MKLAIYGYDTIVGKQVLDLLESDSLLTLEDFYPLSPIAGEYDAVPLRGKNYLISYVDDFDFAQADVVLFLTTKDESARLLPVAQNAGCIAVDSSHLFAGEQKSLLLLKDINHYLIKEVVDKRLACIPLSLATQIVLALAPLNDTYGIKHAVLTALVSVSEHGELGTQTLAHETTQLLNGLGVDVTDFPAQLAFNVHNRIGELNDQGCSQYEQVILHEVCSLLELKPTDFSLTCMQVPTFYGHTLSVHVELAEDVKLEEVKDLLREQPMLALEEEQVLASDDVDEDGDGGDGENPVADVDADADADVVNAFDATDAEVDSEGDDQTTGADVANSVAAGKAASSSGDAAGNAAASGAERKAAVANAAVLVTPVTCAEMDDKLYIGRLRKAGRATLDFTVVMDNTRCGEATTALDLLHLLQSYRAQGK